MNGVREDNPLEALLDTQVRQKDRRVCAQMQETHRNAAEVSRQSRQRVKLVAWWLKMAEGDFTRVYIHDNYVSFTPAGALAL